VSTRTIVWFRGKDLRISDHAPLRDAVDAGAVIPLFVLDPYFWLSSTSRGSRAARVVKQGE
jgi:deoxyribodipyrimidine photo-lyase